MNDIYAYTACFILSCLAIFQIALVLGAPIGKYAWGGSHTVLPAKLRTGSVISIFLYLLFSIIILDKAELISIIGNDTISTISIWIVTVYLFIGVIMNALSRSKYEQAVMTPVALVLAVLFFLVAMG